MTKNKGNISSFKTAVGLLNIAWSGSLLRVLNKAFNHPMATEEKAAIPLAGGIMQYGYQCGMVWGATLAAGAQAYHQFGSGPHAEAYAIRASQTLVDTFHTLNGNVNCLDITGIDKSSSVLQMTLYFLIKGGAIGCMRRASKFAREAFIKIDQVFTKGEIRNPSPPLSCTTILAKKMGMSDLHRIMVAGLAGGIGLSGEACGALGTAIWKISMDTINKGEKIDFKSPICIATIDRFLKWSEGRFECQKIVGRQFKDIDDHARYLGSGGCEKIIELLTTSSPSD